MNTLKFGNSEWYGSEGNILAYNDENGNFKPLPFDFSRGSIATRVNQQGLIETVQANDARVDYLDNANGALLLEPSRTNLIPYSESFDNVAWAKNNLTVTSNSAISPDGTLNADFLREEATLAYGNIRFLYEDISTTANVPYTFSMFLKKNGTRYISMNLSTTSYSGGCTANFDFDNPTSVVSLTYGTGATLGNASFVSYGNDWYRVFLTVTFSAATTLRTQLNISQTENFTTSYNGNTSNGVLIYGAQAEQGSYPTSIIKTEGSAVTRLADICNNSGNDQVINSTEGVLYVEISFLESSSSANNQISLSDGSANNRIMIYPLSNTQLGLRFNADGSQLVAQTVTVSSLIIYSKIAIKWGNGNYSLYQNGLKVYTQTIASTPIGLDKLNFSNVTETSNLKGNVKDVKIYDTALTDAELAALTQV